MLFDENVFHNRQDFFYDDKEISTDNIEEVKIGEISAQIDREYIHRRFVERYQIYNYIEINKEYK